MRAAAWLRFLLTPLFVAGMVVWSGAQDLVLTAEDDGRTVAVVADQSILINLPGNPSTGYTWLLMSTNGDSVIPTGPAAYIPDPGGGPGSPGTFSFPFLAVHVGATTLALDYLQPWEPTNVARTFSVTIQVTAHTSGPPLSIEFVGSNVVIIWPQAGSTDFYLEGTQTLSPPTWAALNVLPQPVGSDYQVTIAASGAGLFFRLRK